MTNIIVLLVEVLKQLNSELCELVRQSYIEGFNQLFSMCHSSQSYPDKYDYQYHCVTITSRSYDYLVITDALLRRRFC